MLAVVFMIVYLYVTGSIYILVQDKTVSIIGGILVRILSVIVPIPCYLYLYFGIKRHYISKIEEM